jgi:hypothetical protein
MAAHSTWMQMAAELGVPGVLCILGVYLASMRRLWPMTRDRYWVPDPWVHYLARMVIAGVIGFLVAAQFVTIEGIELPYFVVLIGAGLLKITSVPGLMPVDQHYDQNDNAAMTEYLQDSSGRVDARNGGQPI